jgi:hypothetical protein
MGPELRKAPEKISDRRAHECKRWHPGVSIMVSGVLASVSLSLFHSLSDPANLHPKLRKAPGPGGGFGPLGPQVQRLASWCRFGGLAFWPQSLCVYMFLISSLPGPKNLYCTAPNSGKHRRRFRAHECKPWRPGVSVGHGVSHSVALFFSLRREPFKRHAASPWHPDSRTRRRLHDPS